MLRQTTGLFKCLPTLSPVFVDVVANVVEDPVYEVHVILQITRAFECSGTTLTFDLQLGVVTLLVLRQSECLFKCLPTYDFVFANMVTRVMVDLLVYVVRVLVQSIRPIE